MSCPIVAGAAAMVRSPSVGCVAAEAFQAFHIFVIPALVGIVLSPRCSPRGTNFGAVGVVGTIFVILTTPRNIGSRTSCETDQA